MSKDFNKRPQKEWTDQDFQEAYHYVMYGILRAMHVCRSQMDDMMGWNLTGWQSDKKRRLRESFITAAHIAEEECGDEYKRLFYAIYRKI